MSWQGRKKDHPLSKEDAELTQLIIQYNKSLGTEKPIEPPAAKPTSWKNLWVNTQSSPSTMTAPKLTTNREPSPDEVLQGKSISYTRAEALMYADEEPCDSWRYIDELIHHHYPLHAGSDYYRYGYRRSAAPYYKELQFCLGTKTMDPLEAKIAIGRRRHEKLARLRQEGCSEEYWEIRKEPLKNAFPTDPSTMTEDEKKKRIL